VLKTEPSWTGRIATGWALVLFIGNFTVVYDAGGNPTQPLSGTGQMSDICAMIE